MAAATSVALQRGAGVAPDDTTAEERAVRRAQAGDRDAYGELVRMHQELAFRTAYLITHSAHDAEEAVQEAFIKAHRALRRFRAGEPFRPWILRIVTNEAYSVLRSRTRHRTLAERAREGVACHHPESRAAPHTALVAGHERQALLGALAALNERDRQVVICRHVLDLSEAETAAVLGCRRGTVKSRLSRALDRMRAGLEDPR